MKTSCVAVLAAVAPVGAFHVAAPLRVAPRAATSHATRDMSMLFGKPSGGGLKAGLPSVFRSIFGKGKGVSGGNNGLNGGSNDGGNKLPPLGSSAAGDDAKKGGGNPLQSFWKGYNSMLDKQPLLTKALTSMTGFALGDLLAQKFIEKKDDIDWARLIKLASFGFLVHGPTGHWFYGVLDSKIQGTAALTVATKVAIDQLLWNPIFGCMFFGYLGAVDGASPGMIVERIKKNLWTSVRGSWTVWPVAHAINFRFVPTSQRLLYINSIQIGYNCFLSMISQNK